MNQRSGDGVMLLAEEGEGGQCGGTQSRGHPT